MRSIVLSLSLLLLSGCGSAHRPTPEHGDFSSPVFFNSLILYFPLSMDNQTRQLCEDALNKQYTAFATQVAPVLGVVFGVPSPNQPRTVYISPGLYVPATGPLGSTGFVDPSGLIHEAEGPGAICPDMVLHFTESYYPAAKTTALQVNVIGQPPMVFWDYVKAVQAPVTATLKFQRNVP